MNMKNKDDETTHILAKLYRQFLLDCRMVVCSPTFVCMTKPKFMICCDGMNDSHKLGLRSHPLL